jgi:pseudouridine-5'-phosphate glycosidase
MDSEMDEIKNTGLQIFPNPSTVLFTLKMDDVSVANTEVKILDVSGRTIEVLNTKGNKLVSFGSRLLPGVYFVQIKQNNKVITKKIVKQ